MGSLYHPITIGNKTIKGNLFLAPMAGFTDVPFRRMCKSEGADFTFTEMVSAEGLIRNNSRSEKMLRRADGERQLGVQLFASSPDQAKRATELLLAWKPTIIDLNCGCPVPKVVKSGCGATLLKDPIHLAKIIKSMKDVSDVPITVKIRSGWDFRHLNYTEVALRTEEAGAAMITLHARTRAQGYSGHADHSQTASLKKSLKVPVIASGDIFNPESIQNIIDFTGCDGVMIARGAIGNPWIFSRTKKYLLTENLPAEPGVTERITKALEHLTLSIEYKGEQTACKEMRKHLSAYTKGLTGGSSLRKDIVTASTFLEYKNRFKKFLEPNGE